MEKLIDLPNIGPEMERQLNKTNIFTYDDLKKKGSKQAWLDIQSFDSSACLNRLYGLEGAIRGIRWHNLSDDVKKGLKIFYEEHKL
jgi:DNA transformation protein